MACSQEKLNLIHQLLDGEATEQEAHELNIHLESCSFCREEFDALKELESSLNQLELPEVPNNFIEVVMKRLPEKKPSSSPISFWFRRHPIFVSAACFVLLMLGYILALGQDHTFQAKVLKGNGQLAYSGNHTVIVPKGEIIKGDLLIKNGNVKIKGKVEGNVILVNSHSLMASAGEVTGKIEKVNRAVGWVWYEIKTLFQDIFK